ncbi:alpha/beta fold hydrolase [Nocardioides nitrophenolicus]|uniref:alpha/beta fold hydrolase n=1 Tax=Nocardioides nitrophenolicus TaxID=60489 RepID=UPI00195C80BF|nr:alpha/beta hydrolase [Nocardioides nitrophenolicus]MBM7517075.1 pimeloyl-ACP methyl ester carboxylesterase [Nocardioides nitrophenolicus]
MSIRRGYADTPLGQLHYAEAGTGRVVLMLHQTPRSLDEFAEVQALLAADCRTLAMDLPGFGLSAPLAAPQTIEAMADGALALLDALEIDAAVVLGHHTGAVVAQELAVRAPDRVDGLVLSAMPWVDRARRERDHELGVDEAERAEDGGHLVELWRQRRPYYPAGRPDLLDRYVRDALAPGVDPAEGHRAVGRYEMDLRIAGVTAPVLLLAPSDDPFAVPALPAVRAALTGTRSVTTRSLDGGRIPAMEQCADQVAGHVREFLGALR